MKFCLLVLRDKSTKPSQFAFFARHVEQLDDSRRRFTLTAAQIERINPNTKTAPVFRAQADADLTAKIYSRVPVVVEDSKAAAGNPWGISFMAMFHMANDSGLFRTAEQLGEMNFIRRVSNWVREGDDGPARPAINIERYLPLYEAKMVSIYDHRASSYGDRGNDRGFRVLPSTSIDQHANTSYEIEPFYWVPELEVRRLLFERNWQRGWLLGWKDITTSMSERTLIAAPIPVSGCGDTFLLAFPSVRQQISGAILAANWSTLVQDYATRQKVGGLHLKYNVFKQLPTLPPAAYSETDITFIVPKVLELTYTSQSMAPFARDLDFSGPPFVWDEERRAHLRADLDAWYALAYGLSRDELRYVLDPKEVMGADYPSETFRVLQKNEIAKYGEYRTARLVMAAYDRLVSEGMRPRVEGYR